CDRLRGIDAVDDLADQRREPRRVALRPNEESHIPERCRRPRNVGLVGGHLVKAVLPDIADDADTGEPRFASIHCQLLSDRILPRPKASRQRLIDYDDRLVGITLHIIMSTPADGANAYRFEVSGCCSPQVRPWLRQAFRRRSSTDAESAIEW